jgi:hypothetical protein
MSETKKPTVTARIDAIRGAFAKRGPSTQPQLDAPGGKSEGDFRLFSDWDNFSNFHDFRDFTNFSNWGNFGNS